MPIHLGGYLGQIRLSRSSGHCPFTGAKKHIYVSGLRVLCRQLKSSLLFTLHPVLFAIFICSFFDVHSDICYLCFTHALILYVVSILHLEWSLAVACISGADRCAHLSKLCMSGSFLLFAFVFGLKQYHKVRSL